MRIARLLSPLFLVALAACSSSSDPIEPSAISLQKQAEAICLAQRPDGPLPPKPFTTDGCSMWPDSDWGQCCVVHDMEYWCGGSAGDRSASDRRLRQCLADMEKPVMGWVMQAGARSGGFAVFPLPWRWGYGWPWPEDGDP